MARRTFLEYKNQVLHALGNPDSTELDITPEDIVNDALEHLAAMHTWRWLQTSTVSLSIVAGQEYVELPADFGMLIAIEYKSSWVNDFIEAPIARILNWRNASASTTDVGGGYYYAISTGVVKGTPAEGLDAPRLELYPTPADNDADAIQLIHRRFLRRMTADADVPQWPSYMDRALSMLARSMAKTDYDDDPESAYTTEFRNLIPDLMSRDGLSIKSHGQMKSGVLPARGGVPFGYPDAGIPDPVNI